MFCQTESGNDHFRYVQTLGLDLLWSLVIFIFLLEFYICVGSLVLTFCVVWINLCLWKLYALILCGHIRDFCMIFACFLRVHTFCLFFCLSWTSYSMMFLAFAKLNSWMRVGLLKIMFCVGWQEKRQIQHYLVWQYRKTQAKGAANNSQKKLIWISSCSANMIRVLRFIKLWQ